jgi:molecular chaperone DnaJ
LGDEITIKTLDGEKEVSVPAGIQNGNPIRIKGVGVPYLERNSQRGDHIIIIDVKTPTNISDEEKQLYKRLYEINTKKKYHEKESLLDKVKGAFGG